MVFLSMRIPRFSAGMSRPKVSGFKANKSFVLRFSRSSFQRLCVSEKDIQNLLDENECKTKKTIRIVFYSLCILVLLYFFVCSIDLMGSGLKLVMGTSANSIFESDIMKNPVAGLMVGVMGTVILQSSSTSTAIIVTLVASKCCQTIVCDTQLEFA